MPRSKDNSTGSEFRFIESIRVFNGRAENLKKHQQRIDNTLAFHFDGRGSILLQEIIRHNPPPETGLFKLRIVYADAIEKVEYLSYRIPHFRKFQCFSLPEDFEYRFKSANRKIFDEFSQQAQPDILPVLIQRGLVTDSTFSNLIFKRKDEWFTPAAPLLHGVQLQKIMETHRVQSIEIRKNELKTFDAIYPVNALNPIGSIAPVPVV